LSKIKFKCDKILGIFRTEIDGLRVGDDGVCFDSRTAV